MLENLLKTDAGADAPSSPSLPADPAPAGTQPAADLGRDILLRPFDPLKFRPEKDRLGRWKNLHAGRKPRNPAAPGVSARADTPAEPLPDFQQALKLLESGDNPDPAGTVKGIVENPTVETIIGLIQTALVLIGDDEGVLSDTEKTLLRRPLVRVLEKYGLGADALPPEVDLAVAVAGIAIVRLAKPKTATAWVKAKTWALHWWAGRKGAAVAREVERHAPIPQEPAA